MNSAARRIAALERRYRPVVNPGDQARMVATCHVVARELGIDPTELWDEAARIAQHVPRRPPDVWKRDIAERRGITVADLEADMQRIEAAVDRELASA